MRLRLFLLGIVFSAVTASAGIVENVRYFLAQNNFTAAEAQLDSYRSQRGVDGEYLDAYSWLGRAALDQGQYDQAAAFAKQTKTLALEELKKRPLDAEPHLPLALGAALEVQSQVLAARGQKVQAIALLQSALRTYGSTSIHDRIQKNLNLLVLLQRGRNGVDVCVSVTAREERRVLSRRIQRGARGDRGENDLARRRQRPR